MRRLMTGAAMAVGVALAASAAWSLTLAVQLTPKALAANHRSFTVTTRDVGEFKEFDVVMTADRDGPSFSPFVRGDLTLNAPGEHIALVRLEPEREGRTIRFWFRVAPAAIQSSRFEIGEQNYQVQMKPDGTPAKDEDGQPKYEQQIGGWQYWFMLGDFAQTAGGKG